MRSHRERPVGRVRGAILLFLGTQADMSQALIHKCLYRALLHEPTQTVHLSHLNRLL